MFLIIACVCMCACVTQRERECVRFIVLKMNWNENGFSECLDIRVGQ